MPVMFITRPTRLLAKPGISFVWRLPSQCYQARASFRRSISNVPVTIRPTSDEVKNKMLQPHNLETAVRHLHLDGVVIIEDVVDLEHLDYLNAKMVDDARALQALGDAGPFNYNQGNLQQDAPPVAQYFFPSVFTSEQNHIEE